MQLDHLAHNLARKTICVGQKPVCERAVGCCFRSSTITLYIIHARFTDRVYDLSIETPAAGHICLSAPVWQCHKHRVSACRYLTWMRSSTRPTSPASRRRRTCRRDPRPSTGFHRACGGLGCILVLCQDVLRAHAKRLPSGGYEGWTKPHSEVNTLLFPLKMPVMPLGTLT